MKQKFYRTKRDAKELLDSDDEFGYEYNESSTVPAYEDDTRFDDVVFPWLNKYIYNNTSDESIPNSISSFSILNEEMVVEKMKKLKCGEKSLITTSVLKKADIFCLKCIEPHIPDKTLIWFINFLTYKDLQSNYQFLRSCLVNSAQNLINYSSSYVHEKKYAFDIVIK